jgi:hypothetical protein
VAVVSPSEPQEPPQDPLDALKRLPRRIWWVQGYKRRQRQPDGTWRDVPVKGHVRAHRPSKP